MIKVSNVKTDAPQNFQTELQREIYETLQKLEIAFERVDTDEVITMNDCEEINKKMNMKMVKTLFLCNRKQTEFYLFVTCGDKPFSAKNFSSAFEISRVSFAPCELMEKMLGTKVGAATVLSVLSDKDGLVKVVFDKEVLSNEFYGCSDSTTTGYLKIKTSDITQKFLNFANHDFAAVEV